MSSQEIQQAISNNEFYSITGSQPESWQQAFEVYMPMAKSGDVKAQLNIGVIYYRGDFMDKDMQKAFEWFEKAANSGDPRAHYNLSKMYEIGEFVLPNSSKAKEHMDKAIELGDDRARNKTALANAKAALKQGDREKAKSLYSTLTDNKEAEMGLVACSAIFKSVYNTRIEYSYHSSGEGKNKKFWKWGEAVITEVDLTMTNQSTHSWRGLVKAMTQDKDGFVNVSTIGGVLRAGETQSNIIDPKQYAEAVICGVTVYTDREGSLDKPTFSFTFPDVPVLPDENERRALSNKVLYAQSLMEQHNRTAKPGGCFVLTACYGSHDAPTVLVFRQFRDKHLLRYAAGRYFINWYYTHGPKFAAAIESRPMIRSLFRRVFNLLAKVLPV